MHTAQQNHAPHDEPRNDGAPQPETLSVPQTTSASRGRVSRAWRCFLGTLVLLGVFIVHGCGGGGSGGLGSDSGSGSANLSIQVRDRNTGALLPSTAVATTTPVPGFTPGPTSPPSPLTVRVVGRGFDKSVSFNDAQAGAQFSSVPRGTFQVFVDGVRSSPDIVVASNNTGGSTQNFTVIPGLSNSGSQFASKVTIQGRALLSVRTSTTPTAAGVTPTPTQSGSCPNTGIASGAYQIRVIDYNTKRVVASYSKANTLTNYSITGIPLSGANGKAVSTTFYLQIFTDPSDSSLNTSYSGQSALFTIQPDASGTATLPDICATEGGLIRTPTATTTPGAGTPTAGGGGVGFPTPIGG